MPGAPAKRCGRLPRGSASTLLFSATAWTTITPPGVVITQPDSFGVIWVTTAPSSPLTVYCLIDQKGLFRSLDGGYTWAQMGTLPTVAGPPVTALDSPFCLRVDPTNPNKLYCSQGVRGTSLGFWISTDGGANWTIPSALLTAMSTVGMGTRDVTLFDMKGGRILLSSHTDWTVYGSNQSGIFWTDDDFATVNIVPPIASNLGTCAPWICYDAATAQGNLDTWLWATDGSGIWRTTNAGANWTQVETRSIPHGGLGYCYAQDGRLFCGSQDGPLVSTNNGASFTLDPLPVNFYTYTVGTDGQTLFSAPAYTGTSGLDLPIYSKLESGGSWAASTAETFIDGPFNVWHEPATGLTYASLWNAGLVVMRTRAPR